VWLFSLDGTLQPLPRGSADPAGQFSTGRPLTAPANRTADTAHGRELYMQTCIVCHGEDGLGGQHGNGAPLTRAMPLDEIMNIIGNGRNDMPAWGRVYRPEDIHDVAAFIRDEFVGD
jgi:mono/diheme cytochrome c family protein